VGNTAKFMLVGILVMVIVTAVIWDRQSGDLTAASINRGANRSAPKAGLSTPLADGSENAEGAVKLREKTAEELAAEELMAAMKGQAEAERKPQPLVKVQDTQKVKESAQAPKEAPKPRTYTVETGDSFWTIADKLFNDASLWKEIWKANMQRFPRPDMLKEGATIIIPELDTSKVKLPPASTGREAAPDGMRHYIVQPGDCLGTISQDFYGTAKKWRMILEANGLEDETNLRAGMKIVIPPEKK
jgi:nucleoid-associated protein YgaU